ncbi:MAG: hypothetical protein R8K20_08875 [Gallionellaceae bacterium]
MTIIHCNQEDGWEGLELALGKAIPGDEIRLASGRYRGDKPLHLPDGIHLSGTQEAVLLNAGPGAILSITGEDILVTGLAFASSGQAGQIFILVEKSSRISISGGELDGKLAPKRGWWFVFQAMWRLVLARCIIFAISVWSRRGSSAFIPLVEISETTIAGEAQKEQVCFSLLPLKHPISPAIYKM